MTATVRSQPRSFPVKRIVLMGLAASMVLGAALSWWLLGVMAGRRLQRAELVADRMDPDWRLGDLIASRETIPDEENSALVVLSVLRLMPASWPPVPKNVPSSNPARPPSGGQDILSRIAEIPVNQRLDPWMASELRDELEKLEPAVNLARTLSDMDHGRYPLTIAPNVWTTLLTHAQNVRNVSRLMRADAILRAHDGDLDGALESCRAILQAGRSLGDEPFAISQLVRCALISEGVTAMERVLAQGTPSDAALAKMEDLLREESRYPMLQVAMKGERASMDAIFTKLETGQINMASLGAGTPSLPLVPSYYRYNHALVLELMNQAVDIARMPESEQIDAWVQWSAQSGVRGSILVQFAEALKRLFTPAVEGIGQAHLRNRARLALATAMVAAERHRIASGVMPTNLDFLSDRPELANILDPYVAQPLRVISEDTGLVIYSIGFDREDNHARFHPRGADTFGYDVGLTLFAPEFRALPPAKELPEDVFQNAGDTLVRP